MTVLTKEQLLAPPNRKTVCVPMPEWGEEAEILVAEMTGLDLARLSPMARNFENSSDEEKLRYWLAVAERTVVDESGKRVFADDELIERGGWGIEAAVRVFNAAAGLSASTEGNSEASPSASSRAA